MEGTGHPSAPPLARREMPARRPGVSWRRWLFWIVAAGAAWVFVARAAELERLVETLEQGDARWIALAAGLQIVFYVIYASLYHAAFAAVGVGSRVADLVPVWFASIFLNTVAPGAGPVLFIDDAAQRGESASRAAAGTVLVRIADFGTFSLVLAAGMVYLFLHHDLQPYEITGAVILLAIVLGMCGVLALGLRRPQVLERLLAWVQRGAARGAAWFRRPAPLAADWAARSAGEFSEAAAALAARPCPVAASLALALAAHMVDLFSVWVLFQAFHQPVGLGTLTAGFGIGVLFWIVSITPEGIGVVEGMMALVYASLGVPLERALVVALAFRGLTYWLPLGAGFLVLRRVRSFGAAERTRSEAWAIRLVAALVAAMGVVNLVSALQPPLRERFLVLAPHLPGLARHGARLAATFSGFALLLLAHSLARRKRSAWAITLGLLVLSAASHLLKGLDYEEALLASGLALWMVSLRHHYHARSDTPSVWQGLRTLAAALAFTLVYGTAGFYLLDRHFSVQFGLGAALRQTLVMFTQFYDPGLEPLTGYGRYFAASIYLVAAGTLGGALVLLLRPVLLRRPAAPEERARAAGLVLRYGRSSLARFTLFEDKHYFFSKGGSVIAYAVEGRVAVSLGDPIGPPADAGSAIVAFRDFCGANDWQAAFYQTLPDYLDQYRAAGFQPLHIGDEAIVDLSSFTLAGGASKSIRGAVRKLENLGFRAELHPAPLPADLLEELREVSDEWLTLVHGVEKRFSLGWFDEDYLRDGPAMVVRSPDGAVTAFANVIPEYQANETTIDLMRHRREMERGTMDFLFVRLFEWAREQEFARFNLGLSPLAGVGDSSDDPAVERALHYIYEHVDRFYDFKGLRQFKEKFHPTWEPRFLMHQGTPGLLPVAVALLRADSGGAPLWGYLREFLPEGWRRKS